MIDYSLVSHVAWQVFFYEQLAAILLSLVLGLLSFLMKGRFRAIPMGLLTGVSIWFIIVACGWILLQQAGNPY